MMKSLLHWPKKQNFESVLRVASESYPGVAFSVRKVSLSQRIELLTKVRELTLKNEFLRAGELSDQIEATLADVLVQKLYLEWAVADIDGLEIDGKPASLQMLMERGPETLVSEIAAVVRGQLELSEAARKNS